MYGWTEGPKSKAGLPTLRISNKKALFELGVSLSAKNVFENKNHGLLGEFLRKFEKIVAYRILYKYPSQNASL